MVADSLLGARHSCSANLPSDICARYPGLCSPIPSWSKGSGSVCPSSPSGQSNDSTKQLSSDNVGPFSRRW